MTDTNNYRPFDLQQFLDGAPIQCREGGRAIVIKTDLAGEYPLLGYIQIVEGNDDGRTWSLKGFHLAGHQGPKDIVMAPLGYIDGKSVFCGDAVQLRRDHKEIQTVIPSWARAWTPELWQWPVVQILVTNNPAPTVVTRMTYEQLRKSAESVPVNETHLFAVADAAIARAIADGDVVPAPPPADGVWTYLYNAKTKEWKLLGSAFYKSPHPVYGTPDAIEWVSNMFIHTVPQAKYNELVTVAKQAGCTWSELHGWKAPEPAKRGRDAVMDLNDEHKIYGSREALDFVRKGLATLSVIGVNSKEKP